VTDASSGFGISGARVTTSSGSSATAIAGGRYIMFISSGSVTLTGTATGYSGSSGTSFTAYPGQTVSANFSLSSTATQQYGITVSMSGTGSGSVTANTGTITWSGSTGTASYTSGTSVTLTATADSGSTFDNWGGCDSTSSNTCTVSMSAAKSVTATFSAISGRKAGVDMDGDGKTDLVIWRPGDGWYIVDSSDGTKVKVDSWGNAGDVPVPGDYDGDGKTDIAVWRPSDGMWYVIYSSTGQKVSLGPWGSSTDVPVPGDYDGDGKTDLAVWRPSTGWWYVIKSSDGLRTGQSGSIGMSWGVSTDTPVPGDYDGDGITDYAVWRPSDGWWYIVRSSDGLRTGQSGGSGMSWGMSTDTPVPGDYDGDGWTDIAVWRPSTGWWYIVKSSDGLRTGETGSIGMSWGTSTDIPVSP